MIGRDHEGETVEKENREQTRAPVDAAPPQQLQAPPHVAVRGVSPPEDEDRRTSAAKQGREPSQMRSGRRVRRGCGTAFHYFSYLPIWALASSAVSIAGLIVFPGYAARAVHGARDAVAFLGGDIEPILGWFRVVVSAVTATVVVLFSLALLVGFTAGSASRTRARLRRAARSDGPQLDSAREPTPDPPAAAARAAAAANGGWFGCCCGSGRRRRSRHHFCVRCSILSVASAAAAYAFLVALLCVAVLSALVAATVAAKIGEKASEAAAQGVRQAISLGNRVDARLVNSVAGFAARSGSVGAAAAAIRIPAGMSAVVGGPSGQQAAPAAAAAGPTAASLTGAAAAPGAVAFDGAALPAASAAAPGPAPGSDAAPQQAETAEVPIDVCPKTSCFDAARFPFLRSKQCICDVALVQFNGTLRRVFEDGLRAVVGAALLVAGALCMGMSLAANYVNILWDMYAAPEHYFRVAAGRE